MISIWSTFSARLRKLSADPMPWLQPMGSHPARPLRPLRRRRPRPHPRHRHPRPRLPRRHPRPHLPRRHPRPRLPRRHPRPRLLRRHPRPHLQRRRLRPLQRHRPRPRPRHRRPSRPQRRRPRPHLQRRPPASPPNIAACDLTSSIAAQLAPNVATCDLTPRIAAQLTPNVATCNFTPSIAAQLAPGLPTDVATCDLTSDVPTHVAPGIAPKWTGTPSHRCGRVLRPGLSRTDSKRSRGARHLRASLCFRLVSGAGHGGRLLQHRRRCGAQQPTVRPAYSSGLRLPREQRNSGRQDHGAVVRRHRSVQRLGPTGQSARHPLAPFARRRGPGHLPARGAAPAVDPPNGNLITVEPATDHDRRGRTRDAKRQSRPRGLAHQRSRKVEQGAAARPSR